MNSAGEHENSISEAGEEADLHTHLVNCKKNPGHLEFMPIDSFRLEHLPEDHRDIDLYDLIKATADLTVKISVTITSPERPEFWPNTNSPYFLSDLRGKRTFRSATGRVSRVKKYSEDVDQDYKPCPCDICKTSHNQSKVWWEIYVATAAHVVVDEIEASHTTFRLFYDTKDSPLVILNNKVHVDNVNIEEDRCLLTCVTCDEKLINTFEKMWEHFTSVWIKVREKFEKSRAIHKLSFIVSHPHGCSKQVSVGRWKDNIRVRYSYTRFTYTCTCPGSSGARVNCVGYNGGWFYDHVHSGSLKSGLNYSGVGQVLKLH